MLLYFYDFRDYDSSNSYTDTSSSNNDTPTSWSNSSDYYDMSSFYQYYNLPWLPPPGPPSDSDSDYVLGSEYSDYIPMNLNSLLKKPHSASSRPTFPDYIPMNMNLKSTADYVNVKPEWSKIYPTVDGTPSTNRGMSSTRWHFKALQHAQTSIQSSVDRNFRPPTPPLPRTYDPVYMVLPLPPTEPPPTPPRASPRKRNKKKVRFSGVHYRYIIKEESDEEESDSDDYIQLELVGSHFPIAFSFPILTCFCIPLSFTF